jgi:hypothetical protein
MPEKEGRDRPSVHRKLIRRGKSPGITRHILKELPVIFE